ncbi:LamG-like jellyroll fold domain-containing protein, partial [Thermaurantiacus sp.]
MKRSIRLLIALLTCFAVTRSNAINLQPPPSGNGVSDVYESLYPGLIYNDDPLTGDVCLPIREDITVRPCTNREKALLGVAPTVSVAMPLSMEIHPSGTAVTLRFPTVRGKRYQVQRGEVVALSESQWITVQECGGPVVYKSKMVRTPVGAEIIGTGTDAVVNLPMTRVPRQAQYFSYTCLGDIFSRSGAISDWEEYILRQNPHGELADIDNDGFSNIDEWDAGSDPANWYSRPNSAGGVITLQPHLSIVSGNNQRGLPDQVLSMPVVAEVRNGSLSGPVISGAPIMFWVVTSDGLLSLSGTTPFVNLQTTQTGTDGRVSMYVKLPSTFSTPCPVKVRTGTTEASASLTTGGTTGELLAHWQLDDPNPGPQNPEAIPGRDSSGYGHTLTFHGAPAHLPKAAILGGRMFNTTSGTNDWAQVPGDQRALRQLTGALTMAAWVNLDETHPLLNHPSHFGRILSSKNNYGTFGGIELEYNYYQRRLTFCGRGFEQALAYDVDLSGGWRHVAVTLTPEGGAGRFRPRFFVDGEELKQYTVPFPPQTFPGTIPRLVNISSYFQTTSDGLLSSPAAGTLNFAVGRHAAFSGTAGNHPWLGGLDDVRMYNYPLSAQQVRLLSYRFAPEVRILGGDAQRVIRSGSTIESGTAPAPLEVGVYTNKGVPLVGVPVTFEVLSGPAALYVSGSVVKKTTVVTSGSLARASVMAHTGTSGYGLSDIRVCATTPQGEGAVRFRFETLFVDTDKDQLPDEWELLHFGNLSQTWGGDRDNDGLINGEEYRNGLDPNNPDSNGDGILDGGHFLGVKVWLQDRDLYDDGWELYRDGQFLLTNKQNPKRIWSTTFQVRRGSRSTFTLLRPEIGQFRGHDEYRIAFTATSGTSPDDESNPAITTQWIPSPGNSPLNGLLYYNEPNPPDPSKLRWVYAAKEAGVPSDSDEDELLDHEEATHGTQINNPDSDGDGMADGWEVRYNFQPISPADAPLDTDGDGLTNRQEYEFESNPLLVDTDADQMDDAWEVKEGLDPKNSLDAVKPSAWRNGLTNLQQYFDRSGDDDQDGLSDYSESLWGTGPENADSDADLMADGYEVSDGLRPLDSTDAARDADRDGLTNLDETQRLLLVYDYDSDADGLGDGWEIANGTNPRTALNGILAWWRFDYGLTYPLYDTSGGISDGAVFGEARTEFTQGSQYNFGYYPLSYAPYNFDYRLRLEGKSAYAVVRHTAQTSLSGTAPFTISFQMEPLTSGTGRKAPGYILAKAGAYQVLTGTNNNKLTFKITTTSGTTHSWTTTAAVPEGQSKHVVFTCNPSIGHGAIYIDGALSTQATVAPFIVPLSTEPLIFGSPRSHPRRVPDVCINDLRFYSSILTAAEMAILNSASSLINHEGGQDWDGDGANNAQEFRNGTNPRAADSDGDGISDGEEINGFTAGGSTYFSNPRLRDTDGDGLSDHYERTQSLTDPGRADTDNDGLTDGNEVNLYGTDPTDADSDNDLLPDGWELRYKFNPMSPPGNNEAALDPDEDNRSNLTEYQQNTNPRLKDGPGFEEDTSPQNGVPDYLERDSDDDGLTDLEEVEIYKTNPNNKFTYGGLPDDYRALHNLLPSVPGGSTAPGTGLHANDDPDGDGASNATEAANNTPPRNHNNQTVSVLGAKAISKKPKQFVPAGTSYTPQTFEFGTGTVRVYAPRGSSGYLALAQGSTELFSTGQLILEGGGQTLTLSTGGSAKDCPSSKLGQPAGAGYKFGGRIDISGFLNALPRDAKDFVSFTVTRRDTKEIVITPNEEPPPPQDPGQGGGYGGGGGFGGGGGGGAFGPGAIGLPWRNGGEGNDNTPAPDDENKESCPDFETYASTAIVAVVTAAECGGCTTACETASLRSLDFSIGLGLSDFGDSPASLNIEAKTPSPALATPAALRVEAGEGWQILRTGSTAQLSEIRGPSAKAGIVETGSFSYRIDLFGVSTTGTGYQTAPHKSIVVENPDASPTVFNRLKLTVLSGSAQLIDYLYVFDSGTWALSSGGLRTETLASTWTSGTGQPGSLRTEIRTVRNPSDSSIASKSSKIIKVFPWGEETISETLDPDGAALTTTWDYYDEMTQDGPAYARLKSMQRYDGYWERYTYGPNEFTKVISPFNDAPFNAPENECRVRIRWTNPTDNPRSTEIELVRGIEVSRRYTATVGDEQWEIEATTPGAWWSMASNRITRTRFIREGEFTGRPARMQRPDGTLTLYSYQRTGGVETTTEQTGAPSGSGTAITSGRRTIRVTAANGQTLSEHVYDIATGLLLTSSEVLTSDEQGRPTLTVFEDGTTIQRQYGCCGLEVETGRDGVATFFSYDALRRQTGITRAGVRTQLTLDAEGRTVAETRFGSDNSPMLQRTNTHTPAGILIAHGDALGRQTLISESYTGGVRTVTTTQRDGSTMIESYQRDGQLKQRSGTGVHPVAYEYGVDAQGQWTKEIRLGASGARTEWTTTWHNMSGHPIRIAHADGAFETMAYDHAGRLIRRADADGITQLFAYNARGEQSMAALDADRDGAIGLASVDRVTLTDRSVVLVSGSLVAERTTTRVLPTVGSGSAVVLSTTDQTPNGHFTRTVAASGTTTTLITVDGTGGRTETITRPDGVRTIRVYSQERLITETMRDAANAQISQSTLSYDAHGRLTQSTDARNGTTDYTYTALDELHSVSTPPPATGRPRLVTQYQYDALGRRTVTILPDGTQTTQLYWPTGELKSQSGSQTYPVTYTYDTQG